jgi:hypothetical protein
VSRRRIGAAWRARRAAGAGALVAFLLCCGSGVLAGPLEGIAGWEGDGFHQGYGFATAGLLLNERGGLLLPLRVSGSYLYYNYRDGGAEVTVRAPGAAAMLGPRLARSWGSVTLLAGGEVRWERRLQEGTSVPAAAVARGGAVLQGEGDFRAGRRLRPVALVSYSGSSRYVYGRAALRWQLTNLDWSGPATWLLGVEGVGQGNRDTDAVQGGATVECSLGRLSLSIHGGYKDSASSDSARRRGGYIGAGIYRRF